ncbi:uncharacterized protein DS421_13g408260 [Arachis hypogaea]|nr:uncharacterized protein DS421_13g408260 [Arachis hypogaea]
MIIKQQKTEFEYRSLITFPFSQSDTLKSHTASPFMAPQARAPPFTINCAWSSVAHDSACSELHRPHFTVPRGPPLCALWLSSPTTSTPPLPLSVSRS